MNKESTFAARIKETIKMVGSAERLAGLAGMSARAVGQYAAGTSDPTRSKIVALAAAGGVNVLWLMTGKGPKKTGEPELEIPAPRSRNELVETLTEAYDFSPVGCFTLGRDGTIHTTNLAGAALLRMERCQLIGQNFVSFVAIKDCSLFLSLLGKASTSGVKEVLELSLAPLQVGDLPVFVRVQAIAGSSGQQYHIAVTEIHGKPLEEELQSTIRDLQSFAHSVSHDLRAPLRAINSSASMLMEDFGAVLSEEGIKYISTIIKKSHNMDALIEHVLKFSKSSKKEVINKPIDMKGLVTQLVSMLKDELDGDVEFRIAELPRAKGDWHMIGQTVENLLSNAIKFSRSAAKPIIEVGAVSDQEEHIYFVKDNGIGFNMEHAGTIFGLFQRLHTFEEFEGTGVGLAIVEQTVKKHGGRVWAESRQGEGATFFFSLQKNDASA